MIEKGRISPLQLAILMHPTILATAALIVPSLTMQAAGRDMWMTPFLASIIGLLTVYVMYKLHCKFPNDTFVEYVDTILGPCMGRALSLIYLISFIYSTGIVLREYGEFIVETFLVQTPIIIVMICMAAVCGYSVHAGIEVIARSAQVLVPPAICVIFGMLVIMAPDMHLKQIQPILEHGLFPSVAGSLILGSWFSQFFLIAFLLPILKEKGKPALKWSLISLGVVVLTMLSINFAVLFIFGTLSKDLNYPFLTAVRYISLADFLEHIESLLMSVWLIGIFIKVAVGYYVSVLAAAQCLKLSSYRSLILPIGFLIVLFSIWAAPNFGVLTQILKTTIPFYSLTFQLLLPILLLVLAAIRKGKKQ
ncbi:endospore germination permease [Paenibacillus solisilvae]|uniref:Endospore germination permease n=1 Tax=Paenibacillus solisilvae TaxID=2486751 RepID=A0ABW0VPR5_9BACL